jgi:anti-sigma28 factor (negative regulator of flagellin synthesis)
MEIGKVTSVRAVRAVARETPAGASGVSQVSAERMSAVDANRMSDMARVEQVKAGTMRAVRLAHIEDAIHAGSYRPSASQVANRMLDAAEIDAHLRSLLGGEDH